MSVGSRCEMSVLVCMIAHVKERNTNLVIILSTQRCAQLIVIDSKPRST